MNDFEVLTAQWEGIFIEHGFEQLSGTEHIMLVKGTLFYLGSEIEKNDLLILFKEDGVTAVMQKLTGYFSVVLLLRESLFLIRSFYRGPDLFYLKDKHQMVISTSFKKLFMSSCMPANQWNNNYLHAFLLNDDIPKDRTVSENIMSVSPGDVVQMNLRTRELRIVPCHSSNKVSNIIDEIENNVTIFSREKSVYLYLSGDFDSRLIFHALINKQVPFTALHYLPVDIESDSEVDDVTQLCEKYSVELVFVERSVKLAEYKTVVDADPNSPFDVPFTQDLYQRLEIKDTIGNKDNIIFIGHGGDHLFLQNPPSLCPVDAFYDGGIAKMLAVIRKYCLLKGANFYSVFAEAVKFMLFSKAALTSYPKWLSSPQKRKIQGREKKTIAKQRYNTSIESAIQLSQQCDGDGRVNVISPFLFNNVVACLRDESICDMFSAEYDRVMVRRLAFERYRDPMLWKKRKRSSSQLAFSIFREHKDEMLDVIRASGICDIMSIDINQLAEDFDYNATITLSRTVPNLLNLYRLAVFLRYLQDSA